MTVPFDLIELLRQTQLPNLRVHLLNQYTLLIGGELLNHIFLLSTLDAYITQEILILRVELRPDVFLRCQYLGVVVGFPFCEDTLKVNLMLEVNRTLQII